MLPQEMPAAVTVPEPVPDLETVSIYCWGGFNAKAAVTLAAAVIVILHVPVPEQPPPDQPVKVDPVSAVAVRVTRVP